MGNDPVRTQLFISTLKGVAFEWFCKLPKGSITCWDDLEALFLSCFFEEEADINMHTLLLTKQKERELVKDFIEHFRELAMRSRSGMTPETLVETCRHNFLTPILVQMGVVECKTWKQLQEHGQTAQELVALVRAEEKNNRTPRGGGPPPRRNQDPPVKKETLAADTQQASSSRPTGGGFINRSQVKYSFKDDKVEALFKMLNKGGQQKLPEPRNPEDVGKTDDPRYCLNHRALGHPTKSCWSLKDKLQALVDVGALRLKTEQKAATANRASCIQFGQSPPTPTVVYPIPAVEMRVINSDPHRQQEKELVRTTISRGGTMWIHPDLLDEVTPWTNVSCKKSKGKTKQANVIISSTIEPDSDVNSLTDSEEEEEVLEASVAGPLAAVTRSGQPYLRNYDDAPVQQLEQSQEPVTEPAEQPKTTPKKPREVRYNRPLNKGKAVEVSQPFRFDIINQLANIPARITLYELLKLSKSTREALREALADAKVFVTQLPIGSTIDEPHSLNVSCVPTDIVFTPEDMQVQGRHARPLYFTGYIGSTEITCIQVDPGSALSIMPRRVMEHLSIHAHRLSATDTNIFRFNANSTRPMGKIKLRCQIGDLKSEVTVYVIDADTSYNLLL